jgi:pimeloyl-ACP methyl ester carboxylesterase
MKTYVLVHGAWHGGWCWERVRNLLQATGAQVRTPTLTGLGERAHLASRDTGLATHVADVLEAIESEDLTGVVLVGHSYAGMVVTAVADRAAGRISCLVYLDAVVPANGQCLYDLAPERLKTVCEELARIEGDGWRVPASVATPQFLGLESDEDQAWVLPKLTPHPIQTFRDAVSLDPQFPRMPRSYINCIGHKAFGQPRTRQAEGISDYHEVRAGHDAMVTAPEEVAAILRKLG